MDSSQLQRPHQKHRRLTSMLPRRMLEQAIISSRLFLSSRYNGQRAANGCFSYESLHFTSSFFNILPHDILFGRRYLKNDETSQQHYCDMFTYDPATSPLPHDLHQSCHLNLGLFYCTSTAGKTNIQGGHLPSMIK